MIRRVLAAFAVLLVMTTQTPAQSVIIDNFNQGSFNLTADNSNPSVFQLDSGLSGSNTLGGNRISRAHFVNGGGSGDQVNVNNTANPGKLSTNLTVAPTTGHFHLYYGYTAYNSGSTDPLSGTHTFADINADITSSVPGGNIGVALDFDSIDHNATFVLKLVTDRTGTPSVSVVSKPVALSGSPFVLFFTHDELVAGLISGPGLNFSDVDQVILETGDLPGGTDMTFDNIRFTSVPEPATYLLIAMSGLAVTGGMWYRRRKTANTANTELVAAE